ncbi:3-hydroxybenzoate 6-monooxygenase [Dactylosporangium sp. CA-092794]|uniref:3-hydroxybenzoate 6-monooxygenase n=1 Tax=Dactylosporangium sp. CA-092794 TaxID=3239929 RepID=UPI003D930D7C
MDFPEPLLVVGGGIGGLGAALALARDGYEATVLERAAEFTEIGAGIQLGPNFMRALDRLGLRERVRAEAWLPPNLVFNNAMTGECITRVPVDGGFRERFGAEYALIHRADLHRALLDACADNPRIELHTDSEVGHIESGEDRVQVSTLRGEQYEAPVLVGADGVWSLIREHVIGDGKPQRSGHIAYRAVLRAQDVPADLWSENMNVWLGPRTHLVTYPLRRGELLNLVAVFHSDRYVEGYDRAGQLDELWRHFGAECAQVRRLLECIDSWKYWVLCDREPQRGWSHGRVALVGDAAHPMLQYLAQGAAMSVEDGIRLASELRRCEQLPQAFARYEAARLQRTARAQVTSRLYGYVFHLSGVLAEMRDQIIGGWTPEQHWSAMSWMYDYDNDAPAPEPQLATA